MDIFVSSPFAVEFDVVFEAIEAVAGKQGLEAFRVDKEFVAVEIAEEITRKIRDSRMVIADLTGNRPNVLHEVGQAQILGKPLILISRDDPTEAPFNVRGHRILAYSLDDIPDLTRTLDKALAQATTPNEALRSMLVPISLGRPTKESRFVIAASPLSYRRAIRRQAGYKEFRRTSSDYVGVRGILQSFGLLYGFDALPDVIDPEDFDDSVIGRPMNIYCIASPKANTWTGLLLDKLRDCWTPHLEFKADSTSTDLRNIKLSLCKDGVSLFPNGWTVNDEHDRYEKDFGLIARVPNPYEGNDKFMVAIIAGRSSLGTEAACRAFVDPGIAKKIKGQGIQIEDHRQPFWALVSMRRKLGDRREEAIPESLRFCKAEVFDSSMP